jgi:triosephosphate isomerase
MASVLCVCAVGLINRSAAQLKDIGAQWVILGHSERRHVYKETDDTISRKTSLALDAGLSIIACVGEKLEEREAGSTTDVVFHQLEKFAAGIGNRWDRIVIAYEPVWAIGTGKVATPAQAQEVHQSIRNWLAAKISAEVAHSTRVIYGGSVKASNAAELGAQADIDGFLVGGASLIAAEFIGIANAI